MENSTSFNDIDTENTGDDLINNKRSIMLMEFICEVVLMVIVGIFGVVGNILSVVMFSALKKKQLKFHRLMILLATFDTAYIMLNILLFVVPGLSEEYSRQGYAFLFAPTVMPITQIALTGSVYCTMAISVERYLVVCHPFYTTSKNWSAKRYMIPIILFSVIYNLPRFFELRSCIIIFQNNTNDSPNYQSTEQNYLDNTTDLVTNEGYSSENVTHSSYESSCSDDLNFYDSSGYFLDFVYMIELTTLRKNKYYYCTILILNIVFMGIGPFIILVLLTSLTLRKLITYSRQDNIITPPPLNNLYHARNSMITTAGNETMIPNEGLNKLLKTTEEHINATPSPHPSPCTSIQRSASILVASSPHNLQRPSVATPFTITKRLKTNEIMLSKVSLIISLVFIICHSIRFVPNIYELISRIQDNQFVPWPDWIECFTYMSHLLTVFSASVNFYIYYFARYEIKSVKCLKNCLSEHNSPNVTLIQL